SSDENTYKNMIIDPQPINSGTISIVFKGVLIYTNNTQEEVAIKVKRKNISEKVHHVISDITFLNNIYSFVYRRVNILLTNLISDIKDKFIEQTNFISEQDNILL